MIHSLPTSGLLGTVFRGDGTPAMCRVTSETAAHLKLNGVCEHACKYVSDHEVQNVLVCLQWCQCMQHSSTQDGAYGQYPYDRLQSPRWHGVCGDVWER